VGNTPVRMPKLAVAMSEGTLVEWLVGEGDAVADGQALYVVETDKVEAEVPSSTSGVVHLTGTPGETYPVGAELGWIEAAP
jgi:pyruvate/2-oxoglutarate dehydrogenase complex dihydrolipoamide acyltransferase (E2) component